MKATINLVVSLCFILLSVVCHSQSESNSNQEKPKVALVLSGGGALGVAHIPVLQKLDSLGIVPDLIVGTSMGSIVGGLYAIGYSGDEIAEISRTADWDMLFSGKVSVQNVSNEEKSEFGRYVIDFEIKDKKPKPVLSLLNDQNLREFFTFLTYPVYNISKFDDLPIPYRAMATDIVNGKQVILDEGSIATAMRASMSIPGVFKPVPYQNTLLVDGGVLNNFPVDVAKQLGADFIIGSEVGGGLQTKEKLSNIQTLLFQTGMLSSNLQAEKHKEECNILIDHVPNLKYTAGDFGKSNIIYEEGKVATHAQEQQLIALANRLKPYKQRSHAIPKVDEHAVLDSIIYHGVSKNNLRLVESRSGLKVNKTYTIDDGKEVIDRILGTNLFSSISTSPIIDGDKIGLEITAVEKAHNQAKLAVHFDDYRGVGLLLNYTGRNIIGASSRFLVTLDVAEQPKFRVQYQKIFGEYKRWWFRSEVYGERLDQNVFIRGEAADEMDYKYFHFNNEFNRNLNTLKSYVGIGLEYQQTSLRPEADPNVIPNILNLVNYRFRTTEVYGQFVYNSLNEVFYPTHGLNFEARLGRALNHSASVNFIDTDVDENESGVTNGFTKFRGRFMYVNTFKKNLTVIAGANLGFTFIDALKNGDISYTELGYGGNYYLGGNLKRPRQDDFVFYGLLEDELPVSQFMGVNFGLQYQMMKKVFVTPHVNIATVGFGTFNDYIDDTLTPTGEWQDNLETSSLVSLGAMLSYNSILGPIDLNLTWVNGTNKMRLFFGVGIPIGK
ncbi:patatin-like phospholipase family protein [Formosa sp. A9]|uniref:patatin-like phospholipase family protein n=1 Tax=Formosa sp. A9 TaxID=3442641 RepID=UPI003EBF1BB9